VQYFPTLTTLGYSTIKKKQLTLLSTVMLQLVINQTLWLNYEVIGLYIQYIKLLVKNNLKFLALALSACICESEHL